jgi:tetratricopeptide (TPR) repeat protein
MSSPPSGGDVLKEATYKKLIYINYTLLILALTGFLVYDIFVAKNFEVRSLVKYLVLLVSFIASIAKLSGRSRREVLRKKQVYQKSYGEFIRNAFSNDPKLETQLYSAIHDYNQEKPAEAIKKLEKLRKECHNSDDLYAVTCFTALCYDDIHAFEPASKYYRDALNIRPNTTLASNLGLCRDRLGDQQGAIEAYEYASQLDPKNEYPYNNLAQLYVREGAYEDAIEYAQKAIALNGKMYQAYSALAISHAMLDNTEEYEKAFRQAVANGANGKKIKTFIASMDASL